MSNICLQVGKVYKFVRVGDKLVIAGAESEYHVDILRSFDGFEKLNSREMAERIRQIDDIDMGRMRREEDRKILVYGESITFQFPDEAIKRKMRPKTIMILKNYHPTEEFLEKD